MNLLELGEYKQTIVTKILKAQDIIPIILPNPNSNYEIDDQLLGDPKQGLEGCVYPFLYVPDTVEAAKTFICIETDVLKVVNQHVVDLRLYVQIFTHKSLMQYTEVGMSGTRVDILISKTDKLLNSSRDFGIGRLKLDGCNIVFPQQDYYGRILIYNMSDFNTINKL